MHHKDKKLVTEPAPSNPPPPYPLLSQLPAAPLQKGETHLPTENRRDQNNQAGRQV